MPLKLAAEEEEAMDMTRNIWRMKKNDSLKAFGQSH
jgi:hypothetical protein